MISEPLPRWMLAIIDRLCDCQVFEHSKPPNHVLLNKYAPGEVSFLLYVVCDC